MQNQKSHWRRTTPNVTHNLACLKLIFEPISLERSQSVFTQFRKRHFATRGEGGTEVDYQVAAPTETSTPNLHRATIAQQRVRMEGWRQRRLGSMGTIWKRRNNIKKKNKKREKQ